MTLSYLVAVPLQNTETVHIHANPQQCAAIAEQLHIPALQSFGAEITLEPRRNSILCSGQWQAQWQDHCAISNKVLELELNETLHVRLHWQDADDMPIDDDLITLNQAGQFDLAALLIEYFSIAMPDYPRAPETMPEHSTEEVPKTRPFAGLGDLLKDRYR